ncbi:unnamed protein product [Ixodes pacificus]
MFLQRLLLHSWDSRCFPEATEAKTCKTILHSKPESGLCGRRHPKVNELYPVASRRIGVGLTAFRFHTLSKSRTKASSRTTKCPFHGFRKSWIFRIGKSGITSSQDVPPQTSLNICIRLTNSTRKRFILPFHYS